jgi:hypothetical protein
LVFNRDPRDCDELPTVVVVVVFSQQPLLVSHGGAGGEQTGLSPTNAEERVVHLCKDLRTTVLRGVMMGEWEGWG